MAEPKPVEVISECLSSLQTLRTSVSSVFEQLRKGMGNARYSSDKEKAFLAELRKELNSVNDNLSEVEKQSAKLNKMPQSGLGNLGILSLQPVIDRQPIYAQLIQSYKWSSKMNEYAQHAYSLLQTNNLKRTHTFAGMTPNAKRSRKPIPICHTAPDVAVNNLIVSIDRFPELQMKVSRPLGNPAYVEICIGRTMRVLFVLRGYLVEHVNVKAMSEQFYDDNGKIDIWSCSKYAVFKKIADHLHAATLHYHYPIAPDIAVRSFIMWLRAYQTLFSAKCVKCERHLVNNMPPTWRDYFTCHPYHESCKP